jgi:hypothetical protein
LAVIGIENGELEVEPTDDGYRKVKSATDKVVVRPIIHRGKVLDPYSELRAIGEIRIQVAPKEDRKVVIGLTIKILLGI